MKNLVMHTLYTEDVNRQVVSDILTKYFTSFTIFAASGVWQGIAEPSLVIQILDASFADVSKAAIAIKEANKQAAVLYVANAVKTRLF